MHVYFYLYYFHIIYCSGLRAGTTLTFDVKNVTKKYILYIYTQIYITIITV